MTTDPKPNLSRLEKVDLRQAWNNEARHFTPWLAEAENLRLLGITIGIELELEAKERSVGPFSADILCKDTATGNWVLIENQLERTDHTHLGQLITYGAGLEAVNIVWIARSFTEEHRAAINWLNDISDERFNFFGLEIELWKIGDSPFAPKFNVVCKPNEWSRAVKREGLTDAQSWHLRYWEQFAEFLKQKQFSFCKIPKPRPEHWMNFSVGRSGFTISAVVSSWDSEKEVYAGELRVSLVITNSESRAFLASLKSKREEIEAGLGETLSWYEKDGVTSCKAYLRISIENPTDVKKWSNFNQWLFERIVKFQQLLRPIVANLEPAEVTAAIEDDAKFREVEVR